MPSTSQFPANATTISTLWAPATNLFADDGNYCTLSTGSTEFQTIDLYNFGFGFTSGALITNVVIETEAYAAVNNFYDLDWDVLYNSTIKASGTFVSSGSTVITIFDSSDVGTWIASELLVDTTAGLIYRLKLRGQTARNEAYVDYGKVTVSYVPPASTVSPSTAFCNSATGGDWSNTTNLFADDANYASLTVLSTAPYPVDVYNFNFNISTNATIDNVTMGSEYYTNNPGRASLTWQLFYNSTAVSGIIGASQISTALTQISSSDTGTWTADMLNTNTTAGLLIRLISESTSQTLGDTVYVDYIKLVVTFSEGATGSTTLKTLTANVDLSPSIIRQVGRNLTGNADTSPSIVRSIGRNLTATVDISDTIPRLMGITKTGNASTNPSIIRKVLKTMSASVSTLSSMVRASIFGKTLTANVSLSPSIVRSVLRNLTANVSLSPTIKRDIYKIMNTEVSLSPSIVRLVKKILTANVSLSATMARSLLYYKTITANVSASSSIIRKILRNLTANITTSPTFKRDMFITKTGNVSTSPTIVRLISKILASTSVSLSPSIKRRVGKILTASVDTTSSIARLIKKVLTANVSLSPARLSQISKTITANTSTSPSIIRLISKILTTNIDISVSIIRLIKKILTATVSLASTITRDITTGGTTYFKTLTANVTTSSSMTRLKRLAGWIWNIPKGGPLHQKKNLSRHLRSRRRK